MEQQLQPTRKCVRPRNKLRDRKDKAQEQAQRQKRQSYDHYNDNDKTCAKITKYSCDNGNKGAASKFSAELGHVVTESTVRSMKKAYPSLL